MTPGVPGTLADWPQRALGLLIDWVVGWGPLVVLWVFGAAINVDVIYVLFLLVGWIYSLAVFVYFGMQVGQFGSTPGMRVIGLKCVSKSTGQAIGAGMGIARAFVHIVDSIICYVGWLFPLWDAQRQTLADKIMGTLVVKVPAEGFSITPKAA
ncbi:MAG TPA: RDD family protein [Acidimicrobiales bacterium]|nr:RDD family protein [Acidimicrobiales bacterium]